MDSNSKSCDQNPVYGPLPEQPPEPTPAQRQRMGLALELAKQAAQKGEVPIGAVIFLGDQVVGQGHNLRESTQDPTAHAEMIAIRQAAQHVGSWRLIDCELYVTLEPCPMCAGAIVNSRMKSCFYAAPDPKGGAVNTLYQILNDSRLNHQVDVVQGLCQEESANLLSSFFRAIREGKGVKKPKPNQ